MVYALLSLRLALDAPERVKIHWKNYRIIWNIFFVLWWSWLTLYYRTKLKALGRGIFSISITCTFYPTSSVKVQILICLFLLLPFFASYKFPPLYKFNQLKALVRRSTACLPGVDISVLENISCCSVALWFCWLNRFFFAPLLAEALKVNTDWKEE